MVIWIPSSQWQQLAPCMYALPPSIALVGERRQTQAHALCRPPRSAGCTGGCNQVACKRTAPCCPGGPQCSSKQHGAGSYTSKASGAAAPPDSVADATVMTVPAVGAAGLASPAHCRWAASTCHRAIPPPRPAPARLPYHSSGRQCSRSCAAAGALRLWAPGPGPGAPPAAGLWWRRGPPPWQRPGSSSRSPPSSSGHSSRRRRSSPRRRRH